MAQQLKLAGKHIIVTGASRGIGFAIARLFATHGAERMLVVGRSDTLAQASEAISEGTATEMKISVGSVEDRSFWKYLGHDLVSYRPSIGGFLRAMLRITGQRKVDILVNAAGVAHSSLLVTTKPATIEQVIQTNLMGTIWGCQIVGKEMIRQRRESSNTACIINVASLLGVKGGKGSTVYAASKAGVLGMFLSVIARAVGDLSRGRSHEITSSRAWTFEYQSKCSCPWLCRNVDDRR